ncbi:7tm 6 domain containing protein [Asbolus verrucosus]|uniref:7tm 6 domain containing protein n=1 Tax=Asbolus verrucosus TaxID=1661398 RepID=A0A482W6C9_ASBVE|nr:7tm 6 domain containing protein [Asbolus verrucosus]
MAFFTIKLFPFIRSGSKIKLCINYLDSSYFAMFRKDQKKVIEECVNVNRRNSMVFFVGVIVSLGLWNLTVLWRDNKLPLNLWVPFSPTENIMNFCIVYLIITIGITYTALSSVGIDPLIGGLAYHASGQMRSNLLITSVYMGNWYEYDIKSKKALIIFMESSKRPMIAVAGKLFELSLGTFVTILVD